MSILTSCLVGLLFAGDPVPPPTYNINTRQFKIPVHVKPDKRDQIDHLRIYISANQGKTWRPFAKATPDEDHFTFTAPKDGLYWFVLQTVDKDHRKDPPDIRKVDAVLRVQVDTTAKPQPQKAEPLDLEQEVKALRAEVQELKKRLAELEKKQIGKP